METAACVLLHQGQVRSFMVAVPPDGVTRMLQGPDAWRRAVVGAELHEGAVLAFQAPTGLQMPGQEVQLASPGRKTFLEVERFLSLAARNCSPLSLINCRAAPRLSTGVSIAAKAT